MDIVTYALCKKIAAAAVSGISGMTVDGQTLSITTKDGQVLTIDFPTPEDGVSITDVTIDENNHIICTMSNGTTEDAGEVPMYIPQKGKDYYTEEDKKEIVADVTESVSASLVLEEI